MDSAPLAFAALETGGDREWLTGRPREGGTPLLILQPLFGEMNRTRRLIGDIARGLSSRGYSPWWLDLPGMGESTRPLETVRLADWHAAIAAAVNHLRPIACLSFRGGALLEPDEALQRWRLAPVEGRDVVRQLRRTQGGGQSDGGDIAGYAMATDLLDALAGLVVPSGGARTVRLSGAGIDADTLVAGTPLWRRAEPGEDHVLAETLATDIAEWLATCAA